MSELQFDPGVEGLRMEATTLSTSLHYSNFFEAHSALEAGLRRLSGHESTIHTESQIGRLLCDDGLVSVREGLYVQDPDQVEGRYVNGVELMHEGEAMIRRSLAKTAGILPPETAKAPDSPLNRALRANHALTLQYYLRARQARRLVSAPMFSDGSLRPEPDDNPQIQAQLDEIHANLRHCDTPDVAVRAYAAMAIHERAEASSDPGRGAARWLLPGLVTFGRGLRTDPINTLIPLIDVSTAAQSAIRRKTASELAVRYEHLK